MQVPVENCYRNCVCMRACVCVSVYVHMHLCVCSHDGHYIICGSEDQSVYIWRTQHEFYKLSSARRDRSDYWESVKGEADFTVSQCSEQILLM